MSEVIPFDVQRLDDAKKMKELGVDYTIIMKISGFTSEEIDRLS